MSGYDPEELRGDRLVDDVMQTLEDDFKNV